MSLAQSFARTGFARFVNSPAGRWARIIVGIALIVWGYRQQGTGGIVFLVVGLIPLLAGSFDWCLISPLVGGPVSGSAVRRMAQGDR
jgi:hypothetical protein